ncbi:DUF4231 domain-containing protein [Streptomyces sp. AK02-01A]|uniref:DUF4231 domain-containing protein n=1 Tax=Streptomyces sp. AK02-01A TaxID=3028648 RepID=UPI0029A79BFB|nr:DUF4231 domain-containing protein [Streptomyces sp. AK02-01A]MDX3850600.1 DUF4231 domain-containing protein [Streptomyces sp. AK02-01A]
MVFHNADLPVLFHHADALAIARQRKAVNATRLQLLLLVLGAVPASLPWQARLGGSFQVVSALGALAYAGVLLLTFRSAGHRATSHWQLNRSAAEFIKSLSWRYAVHGAPFDSGAADAAGLFAVRMEAGLGELRKVGWQDPRDGTDGGPGPAGELITAPMRTLREKPFSVRKETYVRDRLIEQRNWYHRRTVVSRHATTLWSATIVLLTLLALLLTALRAFSVTESSAVLGLLSASAAACLAWSEIRRHQPLISAHSLVEEDLAAMHTAMETMVTEEQWANAVYETERIVSPQHTDWLVRHRS